MIAKTSGETAVLDNLEEALGPWAQKILGVVGAARGISLVDSGRVNGGNNTPDGTNNDQSPNDSPSPESPNRLAGNTVMQLEAVSSILSSAASFQREADTLRDCYETAIRPTDFGGLGLDPNHALTQEEEAEVVFLLSAQLEALNSVDRAKTPVLPLSERPNGRRGMTLSEKIFAAHDVARTGYVKPGDIIRVDVDWILASELSWGVSFKISSTGHDVIISEHQPFLTRPLYRAWNNGMTSWGSQASFVTIDFGLREIMWSIRGLWNIPRSSP